MPSAIGRRAFAGDDIFDVEDLLARPDIRAEPVTDLILNDWFWGGVSAPEPVQVQYSWLMPPVRFRPDPPVNTAVVTRQGAGTARAVNTTHRDEFTEYTFTATLDTACVADPAALAGFMVDVYATDPPRQRIPSLTFLLNSRTTEERWLLLGLEIGDRITIVGAPGNWPEGTTSLVVLGIQHAVAVDARVLVLNTSPMIGDDPGEPGPWFRTDVSSVSGTDDLPF